MGFSSVWIILFLLSLSSNYIGATVTRDVKADAPPSADTGDSTDYNPWESCDAGELCLEKRTHTCTNASNPHISCGSLVWKQERLGCYYCSNDLWQEAGSGWSRCVGEGCAGTVQSFSYTCANKAANPSCILLQTRYCNAELTCDGKWASWTADSAECQDQCGEVKRTRVLERSCMKDGKPSTSCAIPKPSTPLVDTYVEYCTANPCQTTTPVPPTTTKMTTSATTSTNAPTTTVPTVTTTSMITTSPVTLSQWSKWSTCNATCDNTQGVKMRTRKCVDRNGKEVASASCKEQKMTEEQTCQLKRSEKCKKEQAVTTADPLIIPLKTTDSTIEVKSIKKSVFKEKKVEIAKPEVTTVINISVNTTLAISEASASLKNEHKILIIVLVITGCLIAIVIIIYAYVVKKKKEQDRKRKVRDISVVGLQSHVGFMQGMERYGFTKSMMPTGDFFPAMEPNADNQSTATPNRLNEIQQRALPQKPLETSIEEINHNQTHVYEDMRLSTDELQAVAHATPPMRRSRSYHEKIHRNRTYTLGIQDLQERRQSLHLPGGYQRRKSLAPAKPPRKSIMMSQENGSHDGSEVKEIPKYLYGSKDKVKVPDLGFINHIKPPSYSPPVSSPEDTKNSLTLPTLATHAHSAPVSPYHTQLGPQIPHSPFLTPVIFPYNGMQFMAPVQGQNGGVVYMPFSPLYPSSPSFQIGQYPQGTPLHGTEVSLRRHSTKTQRPKTMSFVPQISISEADSNLLSPSNSVKSPLLGEYTEMRHMASQSVPPDFEDADSMSVRNRSFTHLHGTQNGSPSKSEPGNENSNKVSAASLTMPEDSDGYLVPTKV